VSESGQLPLVSYVVLSFNHVRFVREAVESILSQDYPAIELIVIDDGSTDGSRELLRSLSAEHGFRLVEKKNGGIVSAVNAGIPLANGKFIVPHASDDISHPTRTREQVDLLLNYPHVGFTVGGIRKISANGVLLEDWQKNAPKLYYFEDFRTGRASVSAVSCMYRAEAIKSVLPLNEEISFEDVQLFWSVTENGWACLREDAIAAVDYRILENSLGRTRRSNLAQDFLHFIARYRAQPWYREVLTRASSGLFVQLAIEDKVRAVKFLFSNFGLISARQTLRGLILLVLPFRLIRRLRSRY
jgi:alpha-1,3-rhamnosyltransferase